MAVVPHRNMLEKDKGNNLKFGTNPRNSVRKSHVGFLSLITLLVFFLWVMAPCTSFNLSAVFQPTDRIHIKTHPAFRIYAVSPSPLLPFFPCYFVKIRKRNANSELRIETFQFGHVSCLPLLCEVLSIPSVLHRFGGYILSKSSF